MREIEIKVRLQDKEGLLAALAGKGVALGEPVHQRDQVFGLPGEAGGDGNTVYSALAAGAYRNAWTRRK